MKYGYGISLELGDKLEDYFKVFDIIEIHLYKELVLQDGFDKYAEELYSKYC